MAAMAVGDKNSCVLEISDYLDLAMNNKVGKEDSEDKQIPRVHSWTTSEINGVCAEGSRVHQVLEFKEVSSEKVQRSLSTRVRVFTNPLVSLDTAGTTEDHQDVYRTVSLMTNPAAQYLTSSSAETFTSISTCVGLKTNNENTKEPLSQLSRKYTKYNKKDVLELASRVEQSPVEKRKMSKVCDSDTPKFSSVMNSKRNSVVFQLFEDSQDCPSHSHVISHGPRPSIFSVFSQIASRSHRPSIFSRLSDFSIVSLSQYYTWNYKKIGIFIMICILVFLMLCGLLLAYWPKLDPHFSLPLF